MSGLGLACLVTSCFTNATYSDVGVWFGIEALHLAAERAPLLSTRHPSQSRAPKVPCLTSFPDPDVHIPLPAGERVPVCWKPVCMQAVLKEKTL